DGPDQLAGIAVGREAVLENLAERAAARQPVVEDASVLAAGQRDGAFERALEDDLDGAGSQDQVRSRQANQVLDALQPTGGREVRPAPRTPDRKLTRNVLADVVPGDAQV